MMCIRFVKVYLGVIIGSLFLMFTSCSEDLNSVSIVKGCEGFLYIKDFEKIVFDAEKNNTNLNLTQEENKVLLEVYSRILKNCKMLNNEPDFSSISAESLNIDTTLFRIALNALAPYIKGEKVVGEGESFSSRLKTKSEGDIDYGWSGFPGGTPIGGGYDTGIGLGGGGQWSESSVEDYIKNDLGKDFMFDVICTTMEFSFFEEKCFAKYWYGSGDIMRIDDEEWIYMQDHANDALSITKWLNLVESGATGEFKEDGSVYEYYETVVSYYDVPDYNYALGSATVAYIDMECAIGLYARYDFNAGANRNFKAEFLTVSMSTLEKLFRPTPFDLMTSFYIGY